jgi:hypothetical protein
MSRRRSFAAIQSVTMKAPTRLLSALFVSGLFAFPADAQIVRRIIGHAIAGKAIKSITGADPGAEIETDDGAKAAGKNDTDAYAPQGSVPLQSQQGKSD